MTTLKALLEYTNDLLSIDRFHDYAPNGLQVEGRDEVAILVSGVTASLADSALNTGDAAGDTYRTVEGLAGSDREELGIGRIYGLVEPMKDHLEGP